MKDKEYSLKEHLLYSTITISICIISLTVGLAIVVVYVKYLGKFLHWVWNIF